MASSESAAGRSIRSIQSVLIVGHGVMGAAVSRTFAAAGFDVTVKTSRLRTGETGDATAGITYTNTWPQPAADLIIELFPEDAATKIALYREVEAHYGTQDYLLATGTSGLDMIELSKPLQHPQRFFGVHYYMPADVVATVEVAAGPDAPARDVDRIAQALRRSGKDPLLMYQPLVGFIVNRLQHALLHEAYSMIEAGITTAADIDRAARAMLGPRMCINGLIRQKDISGLKIHADAQRAIVPTLFHNRQPCALLQDMVARGDTGLQSGKGFYDWQGVSAEQVRRETSRDVGALLEFLKQMPAPTGAAD